MNRAEEQLLDAFRCALADEQVRWAEPVPKEDWLRLVRLASDNKILPMVAEAIYLSPAAAASVSHLSALVRSAKKLTVTQAQHTAEFTLLYRYLAEKGLRPIVTKGIMCRILYPHPNERISIDEDLLVGPEEFGRCHSALVEHGFELLDPNSQLAVDHEVSYIDRETGLYIEVHKCFFPPDSEAYGDCNAALEHAAERAVEITIEGVPMRTLAPTDHLLYLILHAYKHFLHSGVGIRQIADINMFAKEYGSGIDWDHIVAECRKLRIEGLAGAMFRIGSEYLGFGFQHGFGETTVSVEPLLEDVISGGLYGTVDINRLHSGNMTLEAVASQKTGRRARGALRSIFPPVSAIESRYTYLRRCPWLLPAAWAHRGWNYLTKHEYGPVKPSETIKIGNNRINLLKQYGVIDE